MTVVRQRTDDEKLAFLEGFNVCLAGMKRHQSQENSLEEAIATAEVTAESVKATLPETHQF